MFSIGHVNEFKEDIEEERRLFYVAITRAKEKLTIFVCTYQI
ncbi:MAG: ATP-binding domain-containing protein [Bacteroidetes bacterium]|nr:ATP-binding domain-containing protein [Bacteroidota bacterium]